MNDENTASDRYLENSRPAAPVMPFQILPARHEIQYIDGTPDDDYPVRVLEAYLDESRVVTDPPVLGEVINEAQAKRNALLRAAIHELRKARSKEGWAR